MFYLEVGFGQRARSRSRVSAELLENIREEIGRIMSQIDELKAAVAEQTTAITDMQTRVAEDVDALEAKVAELEGGDSPEITGLIESIKTNTQQITTLDPVVQSLPDGGEVSVPSEGQVEPTPPTDGGTGGETPAEPAPPAEEPAPPTDQAPPAGETPAPTEGETPAGETPPAEGEQSGDTGATGGGEGPVEGTGTPS